MTRAAAELRRTQKHTGFWDQGARSPKNALDATPILFLVSRSQHDSNGREALGGRPQQRRARGTRGRRRLAVGGRPATKMTTLRRFTCDDLFSFNAVNTDALTETYNNPFYLTYLATWPEYCLMAEAPGGTGGGGGGGGGGGASTACSSGSSGSAAGYVLGKAEGRAELWHGHVTAVTVAPERRRQGLARRLMDALEAVAADIDEAFFVDLFVRASNRVAIGMYEGMGYRVYRRVIGYYSGGPAVGGGQEEEEDGKVGSKKQQQPQKRQTEDALDMRKAMPRDIYEKSVVPLPNPVRPEDLEFD